MVTDVLPPLPPSLLAGEPRRVGTGGEWVEGPVWLPDHSLLWSDVVGNRLLRWRADGRAEQGYGEGVQVELEPSHHQNGHTLDGEGRLLAASHGERAVVRREADGSWTRLVERWRDRRFHSPNDLVVASDGAVWFTDPRYGLDKPEEGYGGEPEIDGNHVYRLDPSGAVEQVTAAMPAPNGLAFSPDESVLHVADSHTGDLWSFPVVGARTLGEPWRQASGQRPDGLRVDTEGRLWAAAADGVRVWSPGGPGEPATGLGLLAMPHPVANLAFGGPDGTSLAVTATSEVWVVPTTVRDAAAR